MEELVEKTVLEKEVEIILRGEKYNVAPPSIATLILFSKYVGKLPKEVLNKEKPIASLMSNADKLHYLGYAIASAILGVEDFNKKCKLERSMFDRLRFWKETKTIPQGELLAEKINKIEVEEVYSAFVKVLSSMKLNVFFQLTISLLEMNLTKPTREMETTVSGR